jgi:hypothetical protein
MAEIIIKKKVTLEFLGDEYKDSYITFKSIPIGEYEDLISKVDKVEESKSMSEIMKILETYFVEGLFDGQKLAKEDVNQFDGETILKCFETLTGQKTVEGERQLDPKSENESTSPSTTEADTAQK